LQIPEAAIGSIVAAAIGGLVVFISTVLSKEQKTSEFRQMWIDDLRKDISQYISGTTEVVALNNYKKKDREAQTQFIEDNFELIHELQSLEHKIILRLNPEKHQDLIDKVKKFRKEMISAYARSDRESREQALTEDLLSEVKSVLKNEWERVKRGEPTFRSVKWGGLFLVLLLGSLLVKAWLANSDLPEGKPKESTKNNTNTVQQIIIQESLQSSATAAKLTKKTQSIKKIFGSRVLKDDAGCAPK
jgi:hypothetical protein